MRRHAWTRVGGLAAVAVLGGMLAVNAGVAQDASAPGYDAVVQRQSAGHIDPVDAPGHNLEFAVVHIQPGAQLPPHMHPGDQIGYIVSGELTYYVIEGNAEVVRAAGFGTPIAQEAVAAGDVITLGPGDSILEHEGMAHRAENAGDEVVVIHIASLFETGQPISLAYDGTPTP
jgi:quercetin dioxygenase-like cupin family protein